MSAAPKWLDKVLAVPAIGIATNTWFGFGSGVWEAIERCNVKWKTDGQGNVNVRGTAVDIRIERDRGLYLALTPSTVIAGYTFNMSAEQKPGALPHLVSNTDAKQFTELQTNAANTLVEFLKVGFGSAKESEVVRVGIVAESRLVESEAPPGIVRYLADLQSAVRNKLTAVEGSMMAEVAQRADGHDQCHHVTTRNALDRPDDLAFRLDWQRVWKIPTKMTTGKLVDEIGTATVQANLYFERFGSGEL
jgi:hypothetical protein